MSSPRFENNLEFSNFLLSRNIFIYEPLNNETIVAIYFKTPTDESLNKVSYSYFNIYTHDLLEVDGEYKMAVLFMKMNDHAFAWISQDDERQVFHQYDINSKKLSSFEVPNDIIINNIQVLSNDNFVITDNQEHIHLYNESWQEIKVEEDKARQCYKLKCCNDKIISFCYGDDLNNLIQIFNKDLILEREILLLPSHNKFTVASHHMFTEDVTPDLKYFSVNLGYKEVSGQFLQVYLITSANKLLPLRQFPSSVHVLPPKWLADGTLIICTEKGFVQYDPRSNQSNELNDLFKDFNFSAPKKTSELSTSRDFYNKQMRNCIFMPDATIIKITKEGFFTLVSEYTQSLRDKQFDSIVSESLDSTVSGGFFPKELKQIINDYTNRSAYTENQAFKAPSCLPKDLKLEMENLYESIQENTKLPSDIKNSSLSALESLKAMLVLQDSFSVAHTVNTIISTHKNVFPQNFISSLWNKTALTSFFNKVKNTKLINTNNLSSENKKSLHG